VLSMIVLALELHCVLQVNSSRAWQPVLYGVQILLDFPFGKPCPKSVLRFARRWFVVARASRKAHDVDQQGVPRLHACNRRRADTTAQSEHCQASLGDYRWLIDQRIARLAAQSGCRPSFDAKSLSVPCFPASAVVMHKAIAPAHAQVPHCHDIAPNCPGATAQHDA
jgi:hypothetical protein